METEIQSSWLYILNNYVAVCVCIDVSYLLQIKNTRYKDYRNNITIMASVEHPETIDVDSDRPDGK